MQSIFTAHWLPKVAIGLCLAFLVLLAWDLEYQGTRLVQMVSFQSEEKVVSDVNPNDITEEKISHKVVDTGVLPQTDQSSEMDRFTNVHSVQDDIGYIPEDQKSEQDDGSNAEIVEHTTVENLIENSSNHSCIVVHDSFPLTGHLDAGNNTGLIGDDTHTSNTSDKGNDSKVMNLSNEESSQFYVDKMETKHNSGAEPITIPQDFKVILLWTTYKGRQSWWWLRGQLGRKPFMDENCPISTCVLIDDHSLIDRADMLLFFFHDPLNWPPVRYPHQQYVHAMVERPTVGMDWMKEYDNKFNLTMNYRQDADISQHLHGIQQVDPARPGSYIPRIALNSKTRSIVWPVSHCGAESKRDDYAAELGKYIDLDIYGACGKHICWRKWQCFRKFETEYKFYLSFENAICQDYVTEKLYNPLKFELIPIVLGGGDYARVAPPHSYIDVRDFKSPRLLAEYLHNLGQNETEYASYFQWKQSYDIVGDTGRYCKLCEAAHDPSLRQPAKSHYYDWWFNKCDNKLVDRMKENW